MNVNFTNSDLDQIINNTTVSLAASASEAGSVRLNMSLKACENSMIVPEYVVSVIDNDGIMATSRFDNQEVAVALEFYSKKANQIFGVR